MAKQTNTLPAAVPSTSTKADKAHQRGSCGEDGGACPGKRVDAGDEVDVDDDDVSLKMKVKF